MNPFQMLQAMKNPQQVLMNILGRNNPNPMFGNLINMANQGKTQDVENFARNLCKEKRNKF